MNNVYDYWTRVRQQEAELMKSHPEGFVYLFHTASNRVIEADYRNAAQCLTGTEHRLATKQEIAAYKLRSEQIAEEARRKSAAIPDGFGTALVAALQAAIPQQPGRKRTDESTA